MRLAFLILFLANVAAFGYIRFAESRVGADARNALLQISPEKIRVLKRERRDKDTAVPPSSPAATSADAL